MIKHILFLVIVSNLIGCSTKEQDEINVIPKFDDCKALLGKCNSASGEYCLFGYKWGAENNFSNAGIETEGPGITGGNVSYSFQELKTTIYTELEDEIETESFSVLPSCADSLINQAFLDWASFANIQFERLPDNSDSDIKLFVARLTNSGGNGYPNFEASPCQMLAGNIILHPEITSDCILFYPYVLHEIGHSLGLGHSSSDNVMGSIYSNLDGIQSGDIKGIRQIYGQ